MDQSEVYACSTDEALPLTVIVIVQYCDITMLQHTAVYALVLCWLLLGVDAGLQRLSLRELICIWGFSFLCN